MVEGFGIIGGLVMLMVTFTVTVVAPLAAKARLAEPAMEGVQGDATWNVKWAAVLEAVCVVALVTAILLVDGVTVTLELAEAVRDTVCAAPGPATVSQVSVSVVGLAVNVVVA
jgi:hypothetical protein